VAYQNLGSELHDWKIKIRELALKNGLDFFEVVFEVLSSKEMSEVAALGGFPTRYPHWRFGMDFEKLDKQHSYGMGKIYEMVINTDPCYAYLLGSNGMLEQKLVMAHVYGHSDFFKNNYTFSKTNRKMLDQMANHAQRIRRYQEQHGVEVVEEFIDACLSLENLIDQRYPGGKLPGQDKKEEEAAVEKTKVHRFETKGYMDKFVNPKEYIDKQKLQIEEDKNVELLRKFPRQPVRDVLLFLTENAPLETWQQDVINIIRQEAYYFAPQGQTKIMNEGWASFWHSKMLTEEILNDSEIVDFACLHAGTLETAPGGLNPYKLGISLFRDIEYRWDNGQFGAEWEACKDPEAKANWKRETNLGRAKIFEVRKLYNDVSFVDTFLTEDFCRRHKMFNFAMNDRSGQQEIESRDFKSVKERLLSQLTNFGMPVIEVEDANYENRGELHLVHRHYGQDIKGDRAQETLAKLHQIWKRPVLLSTKREGKDETIRFEGEEQKAI